MTDGRKQAEQYAELAKPWRPDQLAGFKVGDRVRLPNIEATFRVTGFQPPALLILRAPSGRELRAGWKAVTRVNREGQR
jgi:hypothetical protein